MGQADNYSLYFKEKLQPARFWKRHNRFLISCTLETPDKNNKVPKEELVEVHLADPGRLKELLIPGKQIWLRPVMNNPQRRTRWSAALVENPEGSGLVSIDSTLPNRLISKALSNNVLSEFKEWTIQKAEYKTDNSRFDFLLTNGNYYLALEVKSVTLVKDGTALFPDAITTRGKKHVHELTEIASHEGWEAAVLFVVQREDAHRVSAAREIDASFADALSYAKSNGVKILGIRCRVTPQAVSIDKFIPAGWS